jgi:hypothetical protein
LPPPATRRPNERDATPQIDPLRAAYRRQDDPVFDNARKLPFHAT